MKYKLASTLLVVAALVAATFSAATTTAPPARAADPFYVDKCPPGGSATKPPCDGDSAILRWNEQLLRVIRAYPRETGPTITSRALGVLHTATYDAWAAYDPIAKGTNPNGNGPAQQDKALINEANKKEAISYAAYRVLIDLFPPVAGKFPPTGAYQHPDILLKGINNPPNPPPNPPYDPANTTLASPTDTKATPAAVGNLAAKAVLDFRHNDGSNQLGDHPNTPEPKTAYKDYTGYKLKNQWNSVTNKWKWQPLCVLTPDGVTKWKENPPNSLPLTPSECPPPPAPEGSYYVQQRPLTPQWGNVITFSGLGPSQFQRMVPGPPRTSVGTGYSDADVTTALADTDLSSTTDGDRKKVIAEYWADGPGTEFPPGHTAIFAQALSRKKFMNNTDSNAKLDYDAKLFFMVGNAEMDAGIAAWSLKFYYDFWRPTTAIRYLYDSTLIPTPPLVKSWQGPGLGYANVKGEKWIPFQALNVVTPNFPEYPSGHSSFTAAGASLLSMFNGSDTFGAGVIIGDDETLKIEPGVPASPVTLSWPTFTDASNEAGMSRRYGGIHFYSGDMHGRGVGRQVANYVYSKAQNYIKGYIGK
jgi:PAP2 superfamily